MNTLEQAKLLESINKLKLQKDFSNYPINELLKLKTFNGIAEFNFNNFPFYMLNIANDDGVVLKYLWKDNYEKMSLNLWYRITREDGYCIDIGAHTGIYSIIGSLNKKSPLMLSFEPHILNYSRLLDNLKINSLTTKHSYMAAVSNQKKTLKFQSSFGTYHTAGGRLTDKGNMTVNGVTIDSINFNDKVRAIKIDTEGHEYEVLEGSQKMILNNKPEIIFEINRISFNSCISFLKNFGYKFYFIDEINENFVEIDQFDESFVNTEGSNCFATLKKPI